MPAQYFTYQKTTYHLRYDMEACKGAYLVESPYLINLNLDDRGIDPADLEHPGQYSYKVLKYDHMALLTVKGLGAYFQVILTSEISMEDFHTFCYRMRKSVSIRWLVVAYLYAQLEAVVSQGLSFPGNRLALQVSWLS